MTHDRASERRPALHTTPWVAFVALLMRDLNVLRKNIVEFIVRVGDAAAAVRVRVHLRVPEDRVRGRRARAAEATFSSLLVPGVVAIACMFQGMQAVALPLVRSSGSRARSKTG